LLIGNATRVPENPGNPPVFKPVNPGLCAGKNPGLTGLFSGVSSQYTQNTHSTAREIRSPALTSLARCPGESDFQLNCCYQTWSTKFIGVGM